MSNADVNKVVTIYAEATPNPETVKFVLNKPLAEKGVFEFDKGDDKVQHSELAKRLFEFDFVESVFIMHNFVSVTKNPSYKWVELVQGLKETVKTFVEEGNVAVDPSYVEESTQVTATGDETEIEAKIKEILENQVRPAVEQDGGFIEFKSFDNGLVTLILRGACSGCPSSMVTLKAGIEGMLKRFIPEVNEVVAEAM